MCTVCTENSVLSVLDSNLQCSECEVSKGRDKDRRTINKILELSNKIYIYMTSIQVSKSKVFCFHCTEPSTFLVSRLVSSSTNTKPYLNQSVQSEAGTLEAAPGWRLVSVSSVAAPRSVVLCTPGLSVLCCCSVTTTTIDPPRSSCWSPSWLDSSCSSTPATP